MSMTLLQSAKMALRIVTDAYDSEITDLIEAGKADLGVTDVYYIDETDPLIKRAVLTYVRLHFGQPEDYDRMKASYDEQKAQLATSSSYTEWGEANAGGCYTRKTNTASSGQLKRSGSSIAMLAE